MTSVLNTPDSESYNVKTPLTLEVQIPFKLIHMYKPWTEVMQVCQ